MEQRKITYLEKKKALSKEFLQLAQRTNKVRALRPRVQSGIDLWCLHQETSYQAFVYQFLNLSKKDLVRPSRQSIDAADRKLAKQLQRQKSLCIFLLEDGRPLAKAYEQTGNRPILVRFGRKTLPKGNPLLYFLLFRAVNVAVARSRTWQSFQKQYVKALGHSITTGDRAVIDKKIEHLLRPYLSRLQKAKMEHRRITLVDSGMQGTFALLITEWIAHNMQLPQKQVDIFLLGIYPWLRSVFRNRFISSDPSLIFHFEHKSPH